MRLRRPSRVRLFALLVAGCPLLVACAGGADPALRAEGGATARPASSTLGPCLRQGEELVRETEGVSARPGECIATRTYALAPDPDSLSSAEEAVRQHGFGRDPLRRDDRPVPAGTGGPETYVEVQGDRVLGRYQVLQVEDGGWVLVSYVASIRG